MNHFYVGGTCLLVFECWSDSEYLSVKNTISSYKWSKRTRITRNVKPGFIKKIYFLFYSNINSMSFLPHLTICYAVQNIICGWMRGRIPFEPSSSLFQSLLVSFATTGEKTVAAVMATKNTTVRISGGQTLKARFSLIVHKDDALCNYPRERYGHLDFPFFLY